MLAALLRYPRKERRAIARRWGLRSQAVQAAKRMERGPDAETVRMRALDDARGQVLRHGVTYSAAHPEGQPWVILRSKHGRTNQVDLHVGELLVTTCGLRSIERGMRRAKL